MSLVINQDVVVGDGITEIIATGLDDGEYWGGISRFANTNIFLNTDLGTTPNLAGKKAYNRGGTFGTTALSGSFDPKAPASYDIQTLQFSLYKQEEHTAFRSAWGGTNGDLVFSHQSGYSAGGWDSLSFYSGGFALQGHFQLYKRDITPVIVDEGTISGAVQAIWTGLEKNVLYELELRKVQVGSGGSLGYFYFRDSGGTRQTFSNAYQQMYNGTSINTGAVVQQNGYLGWHDQVQGGGTRLRFAIQANGLISHCETAVDFRGAGLGSRWMENIHGTHYTAGTHDISQLEIQNSPNLITADYTLRKIG